MTLPAWPAGLPYKSSTDGLSITQLTNPPLSNPNNGGTTRKRRKYTLAISTETLSIQMTPAQVATFQAFYRDTLGNGAARFTMPVWNGSTWPTRTVVLDDSGQPKVGPFAFGKRTVQFTVAIENL